MGFDFKRCHTKKRIVSSGQRDGFLIYKQKSGKKGRYWQKSA